MNSQSRAQLIMQNGSKTFSFAAAVLSPNELLGTRLLYSFCRVTDDSVDQASSRQEATEAIHILKKYLDPMAALTASKETSEFVRAAHLPAELKDEKPDLFRALQFWFEVEWLFDVPREYALELVRGAEMDSTGFTPKTTEDLLLYCYRVAGVVGLMMCHVLGVKDQSALQSAVDLGTAMQLTNIARDLKEDFQMGRSYVPQDWGLWGTSTQNTLLNTDDAFIAAKKLVAIADVLYRSGQNGYVALPFRARFAVAIAARLYRRIGTRIIARGPKAIQTRMIVPTFEKVVLAVPAAIQVLAISIAKFFATRLTSRAMQREREKTLFASASDLSLYTFEQAAKNQIERIQQTGLL